MTELEQYRSNKFTEIFKDITAQEIKDMPLSYIQAAFITGFDNGIEYSKTSIKEGL